MRRSWAHPTADVRSRGVRHRLRGDRPPRGVSDGEPAMGCASAPGAVHRSACCARAAGRWWTSPVGAAVPVDRHGRWHAATRGVVGWPDVDRSHGDRSDGLSAVGVRRPAPPIAPCGTRRPCGDEGGPGTGRACGHPSATDHAVLHSRSGDGGPGWWGGPGRGVVIRRTEPVRIPAGGHWVGTSAMSLHGRPEGCCARTAGARAVRGSSARRRGRHACTGVPRLPRRHQRPLGPARRGTVRDRGRASRFR